MNQFFQAYFKYSRKCNQFNICHKPLSGFYPLNCIFIHIQPVQL